MERVLLACSAEQPRKLLCELLSTAGYSCISAVQSGSEARRRLLEHDFDFLVINTPLSDEFGHELALCGAQFSAAGILLLVKNEWADEISAKVEEAGIMVVGKPIGKQFFHQALKLVATSRRRLLGLQSENQRLQKQIEEIRLVNRAKCALIQYLSMTEAQAHRYIEKQAMDLRATRREIAERILKTYE